MRGCTVRQMLLGSKGNVVSKTMAAERIVLAE